MLILINTLIQVTKFDLILDQFFQFDIQFWGKSVIIFGVDMCSSVHIDNKNKDTLILGKGPTQGLDHAILTAETEY